MAESITREHLLQLARGSPSFWKYLSDIVERIRQYGPSYSDGHSDQRSTFDALVMVIHTTVDGKALLKEEPTQTYDEDSCMRCWVCPVKMERIPTYFHMCKNPLLVKDFKKDAWKYTVREQMGNGPWEEKTQTVEAVDEHLFLTTVSRGITLRQELITLEKEGIVTQKNHSFFDDKVLSLEHNLLISVDDLLQLFPTP